MYGGDNIMSAKQGQVETISIETRTNQQRKRDQMIDEEVLQVINTFQLSAHLKMHKHERIINTIQVEEQEKLKLVSVNSYNYQADWRFDTRVNTVI